MSASGEPFMGRPMELSHMSTAIPLLLYSGCLELSDNVVQSLQSRETKPYLRYGSFSVRMNHRKLEGV